MAGLLTSTRYLVSMGGTDASILFEAHKWLKGYSLTGCRLTGHRARGRGLETMQVSVALCAEYTSIASAVVTRYYASVFYQDAR